MQKYNQDYFKVGGSNVEDRDETRMNRLSRKAIQAKQAQPEPKKKARKTAVKKAEERKAGKRPAVAGAAATKPRAKGTIDGDPMAHVAAPAARPTPPTRLPTPRAVPRPEKPRAQAKGDVPASRLPNALPSRVGSVARQLFAAPFTVARLLRQLRRK